MTETVTETVTETIREADQSDSAPSPSPDTSVLVDASVEIAQIQADRDVEIAEIQADAVENAADHVAETIVRSVDERLNEVEIECRNISEQVTNLQQSLVLIQAQITGLTELSSSTQETLEEPIAEARTVVTQAEPESGEVVLPVPQTVRKRVIRLL